MKAGDWSDHWQRSLLGTTRTMIAGGDPPAAITGRGAFFTAPVAIAMKIFAVVVTAMLNATMATIDWRRQNQRRRRPTRHLHPRAVARADH